MLHPSIRFIHFIHEWLYSPLLGPGLFCSVIFFTQTVGLLGRVISPSQGRYLHTGQHKHGINAQADIYALSGIRTHDPNVRAGEDSSCLRLRGHCDQLSSIIYLFMYLFIYSFIHQWLYRLLLGPGLSFSFVIFFYTDGRTP
jgi:hypothetical protein